VAPHTRRTTPLQWIAEQTPVLSVHDDRPERTARAGLDIARGELDGEPHALVVIRKRPVPVHDVRNPIRKEAGVKGAHEKLPTGSIARARYAIRRTGATKSLTVATGRRSCKSRLHYYGICAGESEQLFYNTANKPRLDELYRRLVEGETTARLVLRYTDTLSRKLRWTCITYTRGSRDGEIWSVSEARYGDGEFAE
jgi:hypothetical protein